MQIIITSNNIPVGCSNDGFIDWFTIARFLNGDINLGEWRRSGTYNGLTLPELISKFQIRIFEYNKIQGGWIEQKI